MPTTQGAFKIFSLFGIGVYVHWLWFVAAYYLIQWRGHEYSSLIWNVAEYLALFLIVLIHEFGHQLACRSVGGKTHDIVLWPLGGVAYVSPPHRPGAELWSIAAGPLVNVVLVPVFTLLVYVSSRLHWQDSNPDAYNFSNNIWLINVGLLIFNMLPIYPLDGGQILRSLLWFVLGRATSLLVASIVGFIGTGVLIVWAVKAYLAAQDAQGIKNAVWLGIIAIFVLLNCWGGLLHGLALARIAKLPRRDGFACPSCKAAPPIGEYWRCGKCGKPFDAFLTQFACPHCGTQYDSTLCLDCGTSHPVTAWESNPPA
jgi:Zn-dependent protease